MNLALVGTYWTYSPEKDQENPLVLVKVRSIGRKEDDVVMRCRIWMREGLLPQQIEVIQGQFNPFDPTTLEDFLEMADSGILQSFGG